MNRLAYQLRRGYVCGGGLEKAIHLSRTKVIEMARRYIKVAAAQVLTTDRDVVENAKLIRSSIREAHRNKCRIVLFHEGALTGMPVSKATRRKIILDMQQVCRAERGIQRLAKQLGLAVLVGSIGESAGRYYNDLLIINEKGVALGRYAKTWRAGESWVAPGTGPVIFRVAGIDCTAIICHDLRYPEVARLGVAAGAQIVFIANNESGLDSEGKLLGYRSMQISRAAENGVFAVMCNAPADVRDMTRLDTSHGNSMIVDPAGNVLDQAGSFEQRLVIATLDMAGASRTYARRTLGDQDDILRFYRTDCENPAMRDWIRKGLKLVRRLDGTG